MADEQHDPSGLSDPKPFNVPEPMEEGDQRTVPPLSDGRTDPNTTPAAPQEASVEERDREERDREELPDGLEYVSDNDGDGIRQTGLPWLGY